VSDFESIAGSEAPASVEPERKSRSFPSALAILAGVTVLVWLATFIAGTYTLDGEGRPVPGRVARLLRAARCDIAARNPPRHHPRHAAGRSRDPMTPAADNPREGT